MALKHETEIWYSSGSDERHALKLSGWIDIYMNGYQAGIAMQCAEDFHGNHDGWECSWPREFTIFDSEYGCALASFNVEREAIPLFTAHRQMAPNSTNFDF